MKIPPSGAALRRCLKKILLENGHEPCSAAGRSPFVRRIGVGISNFSSPAPSRRIVPQLFGIFPTGVIEIDAVLFRTALTWVQSQSTRFPSGARPSSLMLSDSSGDDQLTSNFSRPRGPVQAGPQSVGEFDVSLIIPDGPLSINEEGLAPLGKPRSTWLWTQVEAVSKKYASISILPSGKIPKKLPLSSSTARR